MRTRSIVLALVMITLTAAAAAPGCDGPAYPPYDRGALLRETTEMVIVPGYTEAATQGAALHASVSTLCAAPSASGLTAAQGAWRSAFLAWQATAPYQLGPARDLNLGPEIASWPTSPAAIEANVAATDTIDAHYIDALGAGSKGFYALEYVLFGYPSFTTTDDAMTLSALGDARRCAYAVALADHVERTTARARDGWTGTSGYAATFTAGFPNATYSSEQAAVNALISQIRDAIEQTKVDRIGRPLGRTVTTGGVESLYAHVSVAAMEARVDGAHDTWTMAPHSPDAFLRTRNAMLADRLLAQFTTSSTTVSALESPPLSPAWETYVSGADHVAGNAAYDALGLLEQTLAGDVASTLGVSIAGAVDGD